VILGIFIGGSEKMKRLLAVTLLLFGIALLASCNSYDVEGKPEIASNPAKMVFAFDPWDAGSSTPEPTAEPTEEPTEEPTAEPTTDPTEEPTTEPTEEPTTDPTEEPTTDPTEDPTTDPTTDPTEDPTDTDSGEGIVEDEAPVYVKTVKTAVADVITEEFEIYNRGVTGELKIRKINLIDPSGENLIANLSDNPTYQKLFQIEVQKMEKGIAVWEGKEAVYNAKGLTFDYMGEDKNDAIASLCPLQLDSADKVCKKGFDPKKYNSKFKIRISYDKASALELKKNPPADYKTSGDFSIEICTNDPTKGKTDTCGESSTSYRIQITRQPNKPPKPIIHVSFKSAITEPMSYRNIYDKVDMDLSKTCVSDPDQPESSRKCLENWQERYYIKYKWEMKESPTPLLDQSKLQLAESSGSAGQWLPDDGKRDNPKRATFTGLMITPRRYPSEANPTYDAEKCTSECGTEPVYDKNNPDDFLFLKLSDYLVCRQKYCEENRSKYYKVSIQAETVDKETDLVSDTAEITVVPKIIPQARVVAQLTWKQGYKTKAEAESKDGTAIDIDIHMIKKSSLEAPQYGFTPTEGLLGTSYRTNDMDAGCPVTMPECEKYWRHDDCSFGDQGLEGIDDGRTIQWHASLDIDNTWGGNNYETPETIGLGPILDEDGDGVPDTPVIDDQYLLVVGYVNCVSNYSDGAGDRCEPGYTGEDSAYTVDARVEILLDGDEAPRDASSDGKRPADSYAKTTKDFQINVNEWKVIAVVKWDNSLPSPESNSSYPGNAIVTDTKADYGDYGIEIDPVNHPVCTYDMADAVLIPIWDPETYKSHITYVDPETNFQIGSCKE
jgi:hypothetical protein